MPKRSGKRGEPDKPTQTRGFKEEVGLGRANVDRDEQGGEMNTEDPVEVRPGQKKGAVPPRRRSTPQPPPR